MTKYSNKSGLIEAIQVEHRLLERTLASVSKEDMVKRGMVGIWSVKDVLAHLTAWEQLLLSWYHTGLSGKSTSLPAPVGRSKKAINTLNQDIYEQNRKRPLASVWGEFQSSYQQVLTTILMVSEEDMFKPGRYAWTGRFTLDRQTAR